MNHTANQVWGWKAVTTMGTRNWANWTRNYIVDSVFLPNEETNHPPPTRTIKEHVLVYLVSSALTKRGGQSFGHSSEDSIVSTKSLRNAETKVAKISCKTYGYPWRYADLSPTLVTRKCVRLILIKNQGYNTKENWLTLHLPNSKQTPNWKEMKLTFKSVNAAIN